jgi:hypothetical protein
VASEPLVLSTIPPGTTLEESAQEEMTASNYLEPAAGVNLESDKPDLENWLCNEIVQEIEAVAPKEGDIDALKGEVKPNKLKEASSMIFCKGRLFSTFTKPSNWFKPSANCGALELHRMECNFIAPLSSQRSDYTSPQCRQVKSARL